MSLNHGINTYKSGTNITDKKKTVVGIPFFVGAWPCHTAGGFKDAPQIAYDFEEAKALGGYSDEWRDVGNAPKWSLCQAMYAQFKLFGVCPAVFCNVFNPSIHKKAVDAATIPVEDHIAKLPMEAINDEALTVKADALELVKGTDYEVYYDEGFCILELLESGSAYAAETIEVAYNAADPSVITAEDVAAAVEKIEACKALFGLVPDLICAPGFSTKPAVAAVMAAKAVSINGMFHGKAVVDIDTGEGTGADDYSKVANWKEKNGYTDEAMIVCWPLAVADRRLFDYSVILCGVMAATDYENGGCPYESPSNKPIPVSGMCVKSGKEVSLSPLQADAVSHTAGVVTAINFDGWRAWGNYTGCWPGSTDPKDHFICCGRMMDYVCNTFVNTFWSYLDRPLTRVLIDAIVNRFNSWMDGLTSEGKLYGGRIEYVAANNPTADLIAGRFRLDAKTASPVPAQEIDMHAEFDVEYLTAAFDA